MTRKKNIYTPPPPLLVENLNCGTATGSVTLFAVDIFLLVNELNVKLQGKDQFLHKMYTNVIAFKSELTLFS